MSRKGCEEVFCAEEYDLLWDGKFRYYLLCSDEGKEINTKRKSAHEVENVPVCVVLSL
jgi:hypothetical protein